MNYNKNNILEKKEKDNYKSSNIISKNNNSNNNSINSNINNSSKIFCQYSICLYSEKDPIDNYKLRIIKARNKWPDTFL